MAALVLDERFSQHQMAALVLDERFLKLAKKFWPIKMPQFIIGTSAFPYTLIAPHFAKRY